MGILTPTELMCYIVTGTQKGEKMIRALKQWYRGVCMFLCLVLMAGVVFLIGLATAGTLLTVIILLNSSHTFSSTSLYPQISMVISWVAWFIIAMYGLYKLGR